MSKCRMIFLFDFCMILSEAHKDLEEVTLGRCHPPQVKTCGYAHETPLGSSIRPFCANRNNITFFYASCVIIAVNSSKLFATLI